MPKELCVTTDYPDDALRAGRHYTKGDLDRMMAYVAALGVRRYQWVFDTIWSLYDENNPVGYDLLAEACEAAHRHGMRFDVQFKPFEDALQGSVLPHTFPAPAGSCCMNHPSGLIHCLRPFLVEHPDMQMARLPGTDEDPGGRIAELRLFKHDDGPAPFGADDLTILSSSWNGGYRVYEGPVVFSETVEWRPGFPYTDEGKRVVTLGGLELPDDTRFVVIRCNAGGSFFNAIERLVEMVNDKGDVIPSMPGYGCPSREAASQRYERICASARLELTRYTRDPEVRERIFDRDRFLEEYQEMRRFPRHWEDVDLCQVDEVAVTRGKLPYATGHANPVYPEVRRYWLDQVKFCIDRNVDGVNIRPATHNRSYEPWVYGFNGPVVAQSRHPGHAEEARRINGEAFTQFLREARELLRRNGKELGVHVLGLYFRHADGAPNSTPFPRNIEWQWKTWVHELADYVELQGAPKLRPENIKEVTDRIGLAAREAGVPFIYRCSSRGRGHNLRFDGPYPTLEREVDYVQRHPDVTEYNLYETAQFGRINEKDEWEGSPDIADLVASRWWRR